MTSCIMLLLSHASALSFSSTLQVGGRAAFCEFRSPALCSVYGRERGAAPPPDGPLIKWELQQRREPHNILLFTSDSQVCFTGCRVGNHTRFTIITTVLL